MKLHIVPLEGTEPEHAASQGCWCYPLVDSDPRIIIHHALDCREKWERQGINTNLKWRVIQKEAQP